MDMKLRKIAEKALERFGISEFINAWHKVKKGASLRDANKSIYDKLDGIIKENKVNATPSELFSTMCSILEDGGNRLNNLLIYMA